ncbi:hypothetical protein ABK040_007422 [Willaertia magna]
MNVQAYCKKYNLHKKSIIYINNIYRTIIKDKKQNKLKIHFKIPSNTKPYIHSTFFTFCKISETTMNDFVIGEKKNIIKKVQLKKYKSPSTKYYQQYNKPRKKFVTLKGNKFIKERIKEIVANRKVVFKRIYGNTIIRNKQSNEILLMTFKNVITKSILLKLKESTNKLKFTDKKLRYSIRFINHYSLFMFLSNDSFTKSIKE